MNSWNILRTNVVLNGDDWVGDDVCIFIYIPMTETPINTLSSVGVRSWNVLNGD